MKTNKSTQYTNELPHEMLSGMGISVQHTPEQLAEMPDDIRHLIAEQAEFLRQHPVNAIYRVAVAGCLTRDGGVGVEFNSTPEEGHKICLENGQWASVLTVGCTVTYPDGSLARIVNGAGSQYTSENRGMALVGSRLDNGDEIISTPQHHTMLVVRDDVPMPEDFLMITAGAV